MKTAGAPPSREMEALRDPEAWRLGERVPETVHLPRDEEEVAAVLAAASRERRRVVIRGSSPGAADGGRGPGEGASTLPPDDGYDILCTAALRGVVEYEPANLTLTAGAGTSLFELARVTAERGQWLPVDPPGAARTTLGALLAEGTAGPLRAGFGRPRDHALGLTAVTGDGRVVGAGGRVVKNVAGFDLVRLFVGSRGRLGVITSATIRLFPLPGADSTLLFELPSTGDAAVLARRLATLPVPLAALELLDPGPPHPPQVAARVLGREEAVEEIARALRRQAGWDDVSRREGEASRRFFEEAGRREEGGAWVIELGFRPSRLESAVRCAEKLRRRLGGVRFFAHALSGGARVVVDAPGARAAAVDGFLDDAGGAGMTARVVRAPLAYLARMGAAEGERERSGPGEGAPRRASEGAGGEAGAAAHGRRRIEAGLEAAFDPEGVLR